MVMKPMSEQDRIDREAADWVVKWEDREHASPREQSRWFDWLRRSPRHVQSYFDTAGIHERLGRVDPQGRIDIDEWLAERRVAVVALAATLAASEAPKKSGFSFLRPYRFAAAVAAAAAIATVSLWNLDFFSSHSYQTAVGQQSVNRLEDGSIVNLNTQSRATVLFSSTERVVELRGEALFAVAHDPARPFLVRTAEATIRAIGTRFNVHEENGATEVAVIEGRVRVDGAAASVGVDLSAGEVAHVGRGGVAKDRAADIQAQLAWQRQQLVFEDVTLAEVAAQFNRYNTVRFRIEGPIGKSKRLSGTFDAMHPQSLLLYLQGDPSVTVEAAGEDYIVRGR
jgi:transmembrane sensor